MIAVTVLKIVLAIPILVISYFLSRYIILEWLNNDLTARIRKISENYKNRLILENADRIYKRKKDKNKLSKIDSLIYNSNIRKYFKYMTSEIYILINIVLSAILSIIVFRVYGSFIFTVIAFFIFPIFSYAILKELGRINFDKVDNCIVPFVDALKNNAKIENNLVYMIDNATRVLREPLKTYNNDFMNDIKSGMPIKSAFDMYIAKVDNIRLKVVLKNLYVCSINNANYSILLDKTKIVLQKYYEQKEKRKAKVTNGQLGILAIVLISCVIMTTLTSFSPDLYYKMLTTFTGQILTGYILSVIIFAFYECITLKDFNY